MNKILTTLTLLLTLCSFTFGQNSQNYYEYNPYLGADMTIVAQVMIDGEVQGNNIELGAFIGDECHGTKRPNSQNIIYHRVYGKDSDKGAVITFKIYDHNLKQELNFKSEHEEITFAGDKIVGSPSMPFIVKFESDYVAKKGDTKYMSLSAAVEAAQDKETITLLKDTEGIGFVIDKDITIDFNGKTYTITKGHSIAIIEGGVLTIGGNGIMSLAGEGEIILNGGQLYHNNEGIMATVKKTFTPQSYWNTISAPIAGGAAIPTNATHDLYRYDEVEHEWEYYLDADGIGFSTLEPGRGYLYAAGKNDITVELHGELNVKNLVLPLSYTQGNALAGFNMIGNPFTHNINESHFSCPTLSEGYYVISENGEWLSRYDDAEAIAPLQSVLVKTSSKENITIYKNANTRSVSEGSIKINVEGSNCHDVAYVSFNEGIGLDKISHNNSTSAMLYITAEGKNYAVATMSKDVTEIPVSFKAMTMGEYTISVKAQNCEFETLYLKDELIGNTIDISNASYTFMATSNDEPNRFVLTTTKPMGIESLTEAFVYTNNDEIIFNNIQGQALVSIIDMMGRTVARYNLFESAVISTSSLKAGMYILHMTDADGVRTQKVIVD